LWLNVGSNDLYAACVVGNLFHWYFCWIFNYQTGSTAKVNYFLVLTDFKKMFYLTYYIEPI